MNELIIQHKNLPLRAYPKGGLKPEMDKFSKWINDLLGLTGIDAAKRLLIAIPAVEKHFWSLGFVEIERAFTKYADGELITQPIPNYFTRILVGQIFKEYKQQKPIKKLKIPQMTPEEKDFKMIEATDRVKKEFHQHGMIIEICHHVYDYLFEKGKLPKDKPYKDAIFKKALELRKSELIQERAVNYSKHKENKDLLKDIKKGNAVINIAKRLVLEDYFKK